MASTCSSPASIDAADQHERRRTPLRLFVLRRDRHGVQHEQRAHPGTALRRRTRRRENPRSSSSRNAASAVKIGGNWARRRAVMALVGALAADACARPPRASARRRARRHDRRLNPFSQSERSDNTKDTAHARLRQELEHFLSVRPDGLAPLARVTLVLSLTDEPADWARVDEMLPRLPEPPPGPCATCTSSRARASCATVASPRRRSTCWGLSSARSSTRSLAGCSRRR